MDEAQLIPFHTSDLTGKRVLVLSPHPDDETIGCGGTLARHSAAGDPVRVVVLTNGAKGDVSGRFDRYTYIGMRQQETRAACACLGISDVWFWPYEDRELAAAGTVVSDLTALISTYHPDLIYAPSPLEFHPDHRAAAGFVQAALIYSRADAEILFYEVGQPLQVDILVDITGVLDQKKRALQQYGSQLKERPYDDVALALNRFRSLTLSREVTHAEGFIRAISLNAAVWNVTKQKRLDELETRLLEKTDKVIALSEKNDMNSSDLLQRSEPAIICHRSRGEKVSSALKRWLGVSKTMQITHELAKIKHRENH